MRRADLADLTAFVAVADNLSFRAAASHIGVTPSALSRTDAAARGAPCGPASGTRCLGTASCRLRDPSPVPFRQNGIAFRDRGPRVSNPAPSSGELYKPDVPPDKSPALMTCSSSEWEGRPGGVRLATQQ
jgi:hypothetical protein